MKTEQIVGLEFQFDAGHKIVNHVGKCGYTHGHRFKTLLDIEFCDTDSLGYALDFNEIKRLIVSYFDERMDHGYLANPKDTIVDYLKMEKSRMWLMSLNGKDSFTNPSAENLAKEMFICATELLGKYVSNYFFPKKNGVPFTIHALTLYETPTCYTKVTAQSIKSEEYVNVMHVHDEDIDNHVIRTGCKQYDKTKLN